MVTNYIERHDHLAAGFKRLGEANPEVMSGFGQIHRAAAGDGALPAKVKELIALAISITSHCDGCISFHTHDALKAGATREEIAEAIGVAILMGGGPAVVYGSDALDAVDQFQQSANGDSAP